MKKYNFKKLWNIFFSFLKIGGFTLGGGYAMIPLIKREVCEKQKWLSEEEFLDGLAAAQSSPGPIAVNISIYSGYNAQGIPGMLVATLGTVLPSFVIIIAIAMLFREFADQKVVSKAFSALEPAVVALIAVPLIDMAKKSGINKRNIWLPFIAALLVGLLNVTPVIIILLSILYTLWETRK
ncbi:MAG: chromate transporter [Candidatus Cloacimonadaceae bacterium]